MNKLMDIKKLEFVTFVLKSLVDKAPVDNSFSNNAIIRIAEFLQSDMTTHEKEFIEEHLEVFQGVSNILKIYSNGGSCVHEIVEANYMDFTELVGTLSKKSE